MHIIKEKKRIRKVVWFQLYDILEKAKTHGDSRKDLRLPGTGGRGGSTEDLQGNETVLYDIIVVATCYHTFIQAQIHRMYKSTPYTTLQINYTPVKLK